MRRSKPTRRKVELAGELRNLDAWAHEHVRPIARFFCERGLSAWDQVTTKDADEYHRVMRRRHGKHGATLRLSALRAALRAVVRTEPPPSDLARFIARRRPRFVGLIRPLLANAPAVADCWVRYLTTFARFFRRRGVSDWRHISAEHVRAFQEELRRFAPPTVRARTAALRAILKAVDELEHRAELRLFLYGL